MNLMPIRRRSLLQNITYFNESFENKLHGTETVIKIEALF